MKLIAITSLLLLLTACGSTGTDDGAVAGADDGLVCHFERESGSHMRTKVCRTQAQIDADREAARQNRQLEDMETSANDVRAGGGR